MPSLGGYTRVVVVFLLELFPEWPSASGVDFHPTIPVCEGAVARLCQGSWYGFLAEKPVHSCAVFHPAELASHSVRQPRFEKPELLH